MTACNHSVPVFGCDSCVSLDKYQILEKAKRETQVPKCPKCGGDTVLIESDPIAMTLYFNCMQAAIYGRDADCDGEVEIQVHR